MTDYYQYIDLSDCPNEVVKKINIIKKKYSCKITIYPKGTDSKSEIDLDVQDIDHQKRELIDKEIQEILKYHGITYISTSAG